MTCVIEQFIVQSLSSRQKRKSGKQTASAKGLDRLNVCKQQANSYHSDYHRFTLQSLKPKLAATLIKMDIYQAELQSRTQNSTKHVCLLMFSCCVIGCKHLLIQLWINRVTAEGLYQVLCRDSAVAFQLETSQSLAPLFSRGLHRGAAICHTAHSHTSCTQCIHCMNKKTHTHKKRKIWEQACSGTNIHTTEKHTRTPTYCTCTFSSL